MDIGIIGGADGPTAIFIASSISSDAIATIVIICIVVVGIVIWKIRKGKQNS